MEIEVYADLVCPWCYLGKRRLERALASYDGAVTVSYRPFQLDPAPVPEPLPLLDALGVKFGGRERARQMADQVTRAAAGDGIDFDFDRALAANTFDAHRLVAWATERDRAAETVEALHRAHFHDGVDIGSRPALATIAGKVGLDAAAAHALLESNGQVAEVHTRLAAARELGITSVPTFVLAGRYAVTGAQDSPTLLAALTEARRHVATEV
ncbi:DsbA family oxidoreductase [Salinispora tropica]|uniref:DSBA oxidoreductase n=1 Tax=Salinispora tropica (strain ATCC BAA-916 / DSM 44818 / JCM 13857 / NBRC 105044 / CNB-440) TaxID=369723 RepID=A4X0V5_SALTO|nr:DsbA family oxidoreductase [Salinispora tropica]ABP52505.1 DSBA oxidoreductase [Salinispora tropica CNB-440]